MTKTTTLSLTALFAALSIFAFEAPPATAGQADCVAWLQASAALEMRGRKREAAKARARYRDCMNVQAMKGAVDLIIEIGTTGGNHGGKGKGGKKHH